MNQDNPYAMNQICKVCGEPAAGFHFGAFTCEGCKSFFGRSYNNVASISDCKNNGQCVINKKNRTSCKACRLRKCISVGMSKSGSRYGRRSNWFKIHCLLQEQHQQAAAVLAAHQNHQQQHQQQVAAAAAAAAAGQKGTPPLPPPGVLGCVPGGGAGPGAAAAAALGMLGHPYASLYPPRSKEEQLMMLGLEEYAKHPAASPSVSSPDSHNSDSSIEVSIRSNPLLHLGASSAGGGGKHIGSAGSSSGTGTSDSMNAAAAAAAAAASSQQLRKDLPPYLPLPFPGLGSAMPTMPPPAAFLTPSSHPLLFAGYHPAFYQQHHQGLLKPSPEQQQAAAAAAAVQHFLNSTTNNRYGTSPVMSIPNMATQQQQQQQHQPTLLHKADGEGSLGPSSRNSSTDTLNNNHIQNGSKAAEELTKRFYLDAVLQSQRNSAGSASACSPPPVTTKLPAYTKYDHSISALVTPNPDQEYLKRRRLSHDRDEGGGSSTIVTAIPPTSATTTINLTTTVEVRDSEDEKEATLSAKEEPRQKTTVTTNPIDNNTSDAPSNGNGSPACDEDLVVSMTPPRSPAASELRPSSNSAAATAGQQDARMQTLQQDNPIDLSMKTSSSVASSSSSLSSKCSTDNDSVRAEDSDDVHDDVDERLSPSISTDSVQRKKRKLHNDDNGDTTPECLPTVMASTEEAHYVDAASSASAVNLGNDSTIKHNNVCNNNSTNNNNNNNSSTNNNNNNNNHGNDSNEASAEEPQNKLLVEMKRKSLSNAMDTEATAALETTVKRMKMQQAPQQQQQQQTHMIDVLMEKATVAAAAAAAVAASATGAGGGVKLTPTPLDLTTKV